MQLLDVVRRLNWLTVDLDRGVRNADAVKAEIAFAERRLDEILTEIRNAAGQSSTEEDFDEESERNGRLGDEVEEEREDEGALEPEAG
jgi:hypothetical protein